MKTLLTADGTKELCRTDDETGEVRVIVSSSGSLGGGTLTITTRSGTEAADDMEQLSLGDSRVFACGTNQVVEAVVAGATSPSITISAAGVK